MAARATITDRYPLISPQLCERLAEHYEASPKYGGREAARQRACVECARGERKFDIVPGSSAALRSVEKALRELSLAQNFSPIEIWGIKKRTAELLFDRREKRIRLPAVQRYGARCFRHALAVDDFYQQAFGEFPVNTKTHLMRAYIGDDSIKNNAYWEDSTKSVYFGTVDKRFFRPFDQSISIVAHEFAHATTCLEYRNQSGALNESWSDVVAIMVEHFVNETTQSAYGDWRIAEEIFVRRGDKESGTALRSMSNPGSAYVNHPVFGDDPQPNHWNDFVTTSDDFGGVHINSGIPNRAFYLTATRIGGPSWNIPGRIWKTAVQNTKPKTGFKRFATMTIEAAKEISDAYADIVAQAWHDVGIDRRR